MVMRGWMLGCFTALVLAVFGGVLFRDRQFGYRDAGHFYYPLHERVQQEWDAGRWPLWAPEANGGTPLLGNPMAAVLYPGKLAFFTLPYPWAARAYLVGHVLVAFGAMWALLRGWRVSAAGATLGAVAYAFGAPVLTQTCNVIYLVGAAWAPLGLLAADRWLRLGRRGAVAGLAAVLALQVMGGDPEAAYITMIAASGYAAGLAAARPPSAVGAVLRRGALALVPVYLGLLALSWWAARAFHASVLAEAAGMPPPWWPPRDLLVGLSWGGALAWSLGRRRVRRAFEARGFWPLIGGLAGASALALAIAGVQLVPAIESARRSFRLARAEGIHDIYPFSVHPLHLAGAIWPDVYGTTDRGNRAWYVGLPPKHEDTLWMPSLYLGGLTLVLASAGVGLRGRPPWRAWLTVVAAVSLLAALGAYTSPVVWARCVPGWGRVLGPVEPHAVATGRDDGLLRDGDGGVYWLLASALPGFWTFRYPAKFLVFTALAVSALAGVGWDRLVAGRSRRAEVVAAGLLAVSLAALAVAWLGAGWLRAWLGALAASSRSGYGPLDVEGAIDDIRAAFGRGALASAAGLAIAALAARRRGLAGSLAVATLALDLALANARHVVTVPQSVFEETPRVLKMIEDAEKADPSPGPFRVQRVGHWWPEEWYRHGSPRRLEEIVRWERGTLRPKYQLPLGVRSTFAFDTTEMVDYAPFFFPMMVDLPEGAALGPAMKPGQEVQYLPRRGLDLWNARYFIVPSYLIWDDAQRGYASLVPNTTQIYPPPGTFKGPDGPARRARWMESDDVRILRNDSAYPRAWIVHRARVIPPLRSSRPSELRKLMLEILYQKDEIWREGSRRVYDPRRLAWVETDRPGEVAPFLSRADPDPAEAVTVTRDDPQRVELTASPHSPGLVILADVYYPGWTLTVDGRPAEILRANRVMRGAALPAGTHRLVFRYDPLSFRAGLLLSMVGVIALAAVVARARPGKRRPRSDPPPDPGEDHV